MRAFPVCRPARASGTSARKVWPADRLEKFWTATLSALSLTEIESKEVLIWWAKVRRASALRKEIKFFRGVRRAKTSLRIPRCLMTQNFGPPSNWRAEEHGRDAFMIRSGSLSCFRGEGHQNAVCELASLRVSEFEEGEWGRRTKGLATGASQECYLKSSSISSNIRG